MRRLSIIALLAVGLAACGSSGGAGKSVRVEFGTSGGNIRPQKFAISANGDLASQLRTAVGSGSSNRVCPGTLPDVAGEYIRLGGKTVTVRGSCEPRFTRLWKRLYALRGAG